CVTFRSSSFASGDSRRHFSSSITEWRLRPSETALRRLSISPGSRETTNAPDPSWTGGVRRVGPRSALLGLPEDVRDLTDIVQEFLAGLRVGRTLGAGGTGGLGGLVEQLVKLRVRLEVRRLEVVRPQHPEVVLDQVGALLLDLDRALAELRVVAVLVLLLDHVHRLGLDAGLSRVVDATREVAVSGGLQTRAKDAGEQSHIVSL